MDDTISRKWLINHLKHRRDAFCKNRTEFLGLSKNDKARVDEMDTCIAEVINAPTIELEREKGKWIKKMSIIEKERYILHDPVWGCSCCNKKYDPVIAKMINFCPNCGADMRGEKDG